MIKELKNLIEACQANIVKYKEIGDDAAVKVTEGMIADFQVCLKEIEEEIE
jgi:hypothetical protein